MNEETDKDTCMPYVEESQTFRNEMWGKEKTHNTNAEWLHNMKEIKIHSQ